MAVEIIDLLQLAYEQKRRKVVFNTPRLHAWVHYYPNPGERDDMHWSQRGPDVLCHRR